MAGGEQDCDLRVWKDIIDRKIVNIIQPDIMYMGGLTRSLKVAKMAAAANMPCTPHSANLSLVTVCTMHFLKAINNQTFFPKEIIIVDSTPNNEISLMIEKFHPNIILLDDGFQPSRGSGRADR